MCFVILLCTFPYRKPIFEVLVVLFNSLFAVTRGVLLWERKGQMHGLTPVKPCLLMWPQYDGFPLSHNERNRRTSHVHNVH